MCHNHRIHLLVRHRCLVSTGHFSFKILRQVIVYQRKVVIFATDISLCYASGGSGHASPLPFDGGVLYLEGVIPLLIAIKVVTVNSLLG